MYDFKCRLVKPVEMDYSLLIMGFVMKIKMSCYFLWLQSQVYAQKRKLGDFL